MMFIHMCMLHLHTHEQHSLHYMIKYTHVAKNSEVAIVETGYVHILCYVRVRATNIPDLRFDHFCFQPEYYEKV